ncbi:MAG: hypothetical protein QOF76_2074, partial [Solirubrobacteraceae bacterium]|nr:hypothetical protein [Solirubrobacteraceae bacterium]
SGAATAGRAVEPRERFVLVAGIGLALLATGAALAFLNDHAREATLSSDALNFQIPQVIRWMQTGSMWQLDQFFPLYSNATYPHDGNILLLATVLPFDDAFLARLVPVPFGLLTCAGVFACAREVGATRGWSVIAAVFPAALPLFVKVALDGAQTDTPMCFATVLALLFLLRHHRTGDRAELVLAGLAIGFAAGTKLYAFTAYPPMVAVWLVARYLQLRDWRAVARDLAWLVGIAGALASPWLIRNLVEAGNPLFPQPLGPFTAPRDIIREQASSSLLDYATDRSVWHDYLRPQFSVFFASPGYVMAGIPVIASAVALKLRDRRMLAFALAGVAAGAIYLAMPYSAFGPKGMPVLAFASMRYAFPALLVGAVCIAWLGTRAGAGPAPKIAAEAGGAARQPWLGAGGRRALEAVLAVGAGVAILDGLGTQYRPPAGFGTDIETSAVIIGVVVAAGALALALRARRVAIGTGLAALVVVAVLVNRDYTIDTYRQSDPALAYLIDHAPAGQRVAIAGRWSTDGISPVLPAFGPRLGNHVTFLGPFEEHLLHDETDPARFAMRLRGYDFLLVGRQLSGGGPAPEEGWARAAGFSEVASSGRLALLERTG